MPSIMGVIPLIRQGILGVTTVFSLIVLGISAHLISQTQQYDRFTATFCALGVAVAVISLVTLPVMLVVDVLRRGAFTSMIAVELSWLSILWILWVATAGETVNAYDLSFPVGCDYLNPIINGMCQETQAIEAFAFLNFIIILLYTGFLCIVAVIASSRGQSVWLSSVKESFDSRASPVEHPMTQFGAPQHPTGIPAPLQYAAGPTPPGTSPGGPPIAV